MSTQFYFMFEACWEGVAAEIMLFMNNNSFKVVNQFFLFNEPK